MLQMYVTYHATVEKSAHTSASMWHTAIMRPTKECRMQNPRPRTPTCIGITTAPRHTKHEKMWVRREPRKYVTCHAAQTGRTSNKGKQRAVWSHAGCTYVINHATVERSAHT